MMQSNSASTLPTTSAIDTPAFTHSGDDNRAFCDGGIFIEGLKDRVCPKCGAGPDDECGYEPGLLAVI